MFTNPANPGFGGQCAFHHRCGVDKGAEIKFAAVSLDLIAEFFQPLAQQFVVVPPERIAADIA
ncbi:hypothetical protein D3C71_1666920 [compost metagenome]